MGGLLFLAFGAVYSFICYRISKSLTQKVTNPTVRGAATASLVVILFFLPGVDGIWGYFNLQTICKSESKTQVLGNVEIPRELVPDGQQPIRLSAIKNFVGTKAAESWVDVRGTTLHRATWSLIRVSDGKEIVRQTDFYYRGSWYLNTNGDGLGAGKCVAEPNLQTVLRTAISRKD